MPAQITRLLQRNSTLFLRHVASCKGTMSYSTTMEKNLDDELRLEYLEGDRQGKSFV